MIGFIKGACIMLAISLCTAALLPVAAWICMFVAAHLPKIG